MKKLALWLSALALLGFAVLLLVPQYTGPPSDDEMIRNLDAHRAVFDRLLTMIREDKGLERVDDDWTRPDDPSTIGVSPARIAEYRRLFAEANIPRGFYSFNEATTVQFIGFAEGLSISGCAKSYLYTTEKEPEGLVDEPLDGHHQDNKAFVRRRIGENWFLQYDSS
jgi:hypothetical protein